jgi:L-ribulose-5-phosphate 3-epimerase
MALGADLGTRVVIVQAGGVPEKDDDPRTKSLRESLLLLGQHADRTGANLALETGLEPGQRLAGFLGTLDTGGLGVNLDPGNLLLHGHDLTESVRALHRLILHAHAKDVRRATANRVAQEVPLGHGDIDWITLLANFAEVEYHGWLVVERETGNDTRAEAIHGVAFLRRMVGVGD